MTHQDSDASSSIGRRSFLRAASAGFAATVAVPATISAEPDMEEIIEQSLRFREKVGSVEKWHEYLQNRGFGVTSDSRTFEVPVPASSEDVSTERYDTDELDITMSLTGQCTVEGTRYYADLSWSYASGWFTGSGAPPVDVAGLGYNTDWWELYSYTISETTSTSEYVSYRDGTMSSGAGLGFDVGDSSISTNGDEDDLHHCGVYLMPIGDYSENERRIQGAYSHTWSEVTIDSVSVGYPLGISVSVSDETNEWKTDTEDDGDTLLRVNQGDMYQTMC